MKRISTILLQAAFIALVVVVLAHSGITLSADIPFHRFRSLQAQVRDKDLELTDSQWAAQWDRLESTLRKKPSHAKALFELGRILHRLAADPDRAEEICRLRNLDPDACRPTRLLESAVGNYDRAILQNRLIGGARFWKLAARVRLDEMGQEPGGRGEPSLSSGEILDELTRSMEFGGTDPLLFKSAGDLAAKAGDEDLAARYYRESLKRSLETLEGIVERVSLFKAGFDALETIVPQTPEAYERASRALVDQWRFETARTYWNHAKSWKNEPILPDEPLNLVNNGRFLDPPGSHFLGWEMQKRAGVNVVGEPGKPGLFFELSHAPDHYFHFQQKIPVEPDVAYRFSGMIHLSSSELRHGATVGFEVIHPYDFSIWSAGARCLIESREGRPACKNREPDEQGNFAIDFDFTPPQPLRMIVLRLVWTNSPGRGRISIDQVRIEKKPTTLENEHAPNSEGIHHHPNEK